MTTNRQSQEVFIIEEGLAPSLHVPPLEGLRQSPQLGQDHDEVVKVKFPTSRVIFDQNILG